MQWISISAKILPIDGAIVIEERKIRWFNLKMIYCYFIKVGVIVKVYIPEEHQNQNQMNHDVYPSKFLF